MMKLTLNYCMTHNWSTDGFHGRCVEIWVMQKAGSFSRPGMYLGKDTAALPGKKQMEGTALMPALQGHQGQARLDVYLV